MRKQTQITLAVIVLTAPLLHACSGGDKEMPAVEAQPAAEAAAEAATMPAARVFIVNPPNGSEVTSPVTVEFGIEGFGLAPAGTYEAATGHHHLLIDTPLPPLDQPIPSDAQHLHFGKAQTSAVVELEPGEHTLQLLLGDGNHVPHDSALISDPVIITVIGEPAE